uniref:Tyrosine-protein kinase BAZ1B n=1 Tax=Anthurium amnicola TaxID=1678845 RepID=A0A1D1Y9M9_9ARAE
MVVSGSPAAGAANMGQVKKASTGKVCDMCGHKGFHERLIACSQCKNSSRHRYCMASFSSPVLEPWLCEACEEENKHTTQLPSKSVPFKTKENVKVKFISVEEVASLASGSKTPVSSPKGCLGASVPRTGLVLKRPSLTSKSTFSRPIRTDMQPIIIKSEVSSAYTDNKQPLTPSHEPSAHCKEETIEGSYVEEHGSFTNVIVAAEQRSSVTRLLPCNDGENSGLCTYVQHIESDPQGGLSSSLLVIRNKNEIQWRGRFVIRDMGDHIYEGIRAHFPEQISIKAYNAARAMPEILQFKLINRQDGWPQIFQLDPPSNEDVAMYFLPSEFGRPKEKYIRLLERMDKHDLALRCCLDGLDLLIYTSKLLQLGPQELNTNLYLWGIFRHCRRKKLNQEARLPQEGTCADIDMEINMIGGDELGKTDTPAANPSVVQRGQLNDGGSMPDQNGTNISKSSSALPMLKNNDEEQKIPNVPPGFAKLRKDDSGCENEVKVVLKKQNIPCVPPGFSKPSMGDSSCEKDIPYVPPCFSKLSKGNSGCEEKVKFALKKPKSCIISNIPPGFSRSLNSSGSAEHSGKSPVHLSYDTGVSASSASREECIISSPIEEKVPLVKNDKSLKTVIGQAEVCRQEGTTEKTSPVSAGFDGAKHISREGSVLPRFPQEIDDREGHSVESPMVSPALSLSRPHYVNDGKQWTPAESRRRLKKDNCGKQVQLTL